MLPLYLSSFILHSFLSLVINACTVILKLLTLFSLFLLWRLCFRQLITNQLVLDWDEIISTRFGVEIITSMRNIYWALFCFFKSVTTANHTCVLFQSGVGVQLINTTTGVSIDALSYVYIYVWFSLSRHHCVKQLNHWRYRKQFRLSR